MPTSTVTNSNNTKTRVSLSDDQIRVISDWIYKRIKKSIFPISADTRFGLTRLIVEAQLTLYPYRTPGEITPKRRNAIIQNLNKIWQNHYPQKTDSVGNKATDDDSLQKIAKWVYDRWDNNQFPIMSDRSTMVVNQLIRYISIAQRTLYPNTTRFVDSEVLRKVINWMNYIWNNEKNSTTVSVASIKDVVAKKEPSKLTPEIAYIIGYEFANYAKTRSDFGELCLGVIDGMKDRLKQSA